MGAFEKLLNIARRPVANVAAVERERAPARGKAADELAATEEELVAALDLARRERVTATGAINTAGARREELLMQPGTDEAIALIGREVDAAQLLLERLERLEPELAYRLSALRDQKRIARWEELRRAYCQAGVNHVAALRAIQLDYGAYSHAFHALVAEFPDATDLLPRFYFLPTGSADQLAAALDKFYLVQYQPRHSTPRKTIRSVQDVIDDGDPEEIALVSGGFGALAPRSGNTKQRIRLRVPVQIEGRWHEARSVVTVHQWTADDEIAAGRATLESDQQEGESR